MHIKLELDDQSLKRGFADFPKANAEAVKNTLNTAAALTRKNARENIRNDFTLRNKFTIGVPGSPKGGQIIYKQAFGTNIKKMHSKVGATERADYMAVQDKGGRRKLSKKSSGSTAIPTTGVRIGFSGAKPVNKKMYLKSIRSQMVKGRIRNKLAAKTPKSRMVARMFVANREGKYFKRSDGSILRVTQFSKIGTNRITARTELLYALVKKPIFIKPKPWLEPATQKPARDIPNIYKSSLRRLWRTGGFD